VQLMYTNKNEFSRKDDKRGAYTTVNLYKTKPKNFTFWKILMDWCCWVIPYSIQKLHSARPGEMRIRLMRREIGKIT
jgi:hypothetical protein